MNRRRAKVGFTESGLAGRFGSLSMTVGVGTLVQFLAAVAGLVSVPIMVSALGVDTFGILVVVVSLAPWLTLIDGALYPSMRLLVGESRAMSSATAPVDLLRSALHLAFRIMGGNFALLGLSLIALPLVALFGAHGIADRDELVRAVLVFAVPIILSGPGGVYLGALEGVGRTVVSTLLVGLGPLVALPAVLAAWILGLDLVPFCAIQGLAVSAPRFAAWIYWRLRPSVEPVDRVASRISLSLVAKQIALSAAVLVQLGLDPVIVSSVLGAGQAASFGIANRIVSGALIPIVLLTPLIGANLAAARSAGWTARRDSELRTLLRQASGAGVVVGLVVAVLGPVLGKALGSGDVATQPSLYLAGGAFVLTTFTSAPLYLAFTGPRGLRRSMVLNGVLMFANVGLSIALVRPLGPAGPLWASALAGAFATGYWLRVWRRKPELLVESHG